MYGPVFKFIVQFVVAQKHRIMFGVPKISVLTESTYVEAGGAVL
jgi:hypothetical protein